MFVWLIKDYIFDIGSIVCGIKCLFGFDLGVRFFGYIYNMGFFGWVWGYG